MGVNVLRLRGFQKYVSLDRNITSKDNPIICLQDIAALRSKIRENNWDLDIDSTWSGH